MKSYSLIFRLVLVFYSAIHIDTVTAVKRRGELFKFNLLRFNRKDSEPFDQPEFDISNEEWERHSLDLHPESSQAPTRWTLFGNSKRLPPRYPPPRLPPSQLPPPRLPFPMPKLPKESEKQTYPSFSEVVDEIFPGLSHTDRPAASKTKENVNEIHVQVNDVADLTNILGYDDIVFSVKNSEPAVIPRPDIGNHRGEIPSKPFWGPPIGSLSTRPNLRPTEKPTTRPYTFTTDADFSSDLSSTVNNVWELTTSVPRNPSEGRSNEAQNNKPTESFWGPDPFGPPFAEHKNPFDSNFWNHEATSTEPTSLNDPTSESQFPKSSESGQHNYFGETASAASPPVIQETEFDEYHHHHSVPGALAMYPPYQTRQEYPNAYHPPAPSYHHPLPVHPPSLMKVDFSPLFLALIPLALVLGAAASFALSSAVTSNRAVATAQQQQQQQEASNSNNNNANSNSNSILALLSALKDDDNYNQPYYVIVNGTSFATGRSAMRRKWEQTLLDLM